jgi:hypothetical protein
MLPSPKMAGTMVPLPVNGRLPVAGAVLPIVVVVTGAPSTPSVTVIPDTVVLVDRADEPVSRTVVGEFGWVVSVVGVVEVVDVVDVDVDVDEDVEVVEVEVDVVVVGPQPSTLCSEADVEKSCDRSGLRMVNLTVPLDGAGPLACQICTGPELPVVS